MTIGIAFDLRTLLLYTVHGNNQTSDTARRNYPPSYTIIGQFLLLRDCDGRGGIEDIAGLVRNLDMTDDTLQNRGQERKRTTHHHLVSL